MRGKTCAKLTTTILLLVVKCDFEADGLTSARCMRQHDHATNERTRSDTTTKNTKAGSVCACACVWACRDTWPYQRS